MKNNIIQDNETKRAEILNIFSALFCQPEEEFITNSKIYDVLESAFEQINPDCLIHVKNLKESTKKYNRQDLLIEYARLFIGPFKIEVPPYSSLYFDKKELMSDVTIWVASYYDNAGLKFDRNIKDLPDHVAVETEFIYYLLFNALNEFNEENEEKANRCISLLEYFLDKHYKIWVPKFCEQIVEKTNNEYYTALASCFELFVKTMDLQDLKKMIENK